MSNIEAISLKIKDFSENEISKLNDFIEFLIYKRRMELITNMDAYIEIFKTKGISDFETLINKIKNEIPIPRSGNNNMFGHSIKKWLTTYFNISHEKAEEILDISEQLGLLRNSGLNNYK